MFALYAQDEISMIDNHMKVIASIRYDNATFTDGEYSIQNATSATSFLLAYQKQLTKANWQGFSPKIALQYTFSEKMRLFASYGKGFRPPSLDDMCRTGKISLGLKIANPELKPENINNFELGADLTPFKNLTISPTYFHSSGNDFIYYLSTGDSIKMGKVWKPILRKDNISKVEINGFELDVNYKPIEQLVLFANYSYASSQIKEFTISNKADNLTDKYLTNVPKSQLNAGATWRNSIVNIQHY